jgi:ATPase subunit of ABC transporter with duplicated ATPase domains
VFAALVLLNLVELAGVVWVGPGFWISAGVTGVLLGAYVMHLRQRAMVEQRRRRAEARYAAWIAARQAAIRREQARRAAARRESLRQQLLEREQARREAARLAAQTAVRGRAYEARAVGQDW